MTQRSRLASIMRYEREARGWVQRDMAERMSELQPHLPAISSSWVARVEIDANTRGPEPQRLALAAQVFARHPIPGKPKKSVEDYTTLLFQAAGLQVSFTDANDPRRDEAYLRLKDAPGADQMMQLFERASPEQREILLGVAAKLVESPAEHDRRRRRRA